MFLAILTRVVVCTNNVQYKWFLFSNKLTTIDVYTNNVWYEWFLFSIFINNLFSLTMTYSFVLYIFLLSHISFPASYQWHTVVQPLHIIRTCQSKHHVNKINIHKWLYCYSFQCFRLMKQSIKELGSFCISSRLNLGTPPPIFIGHWIKN